MSTHDSKSAREIPEAFVKLPPEPVERVERAADPFVVPDPVIPRVTHDRLVVSRDALESMSARTRAFASGVFDEMAEGIRAATYRGITVLVDDSVPPGEAWMVSDAGATRATNIGVDMGAEDSTAFAISLHAHGRRPGKASRFAYSCIIDGPNFIARPILAFVPRKPPSRRAAKRARVAAGLLERVTRRRTRKAPGVAMREFLGPSRFWDDLADAMAFAWGSKGE